MNEINFVAFDLTDTDLYCRFVGKFSIEEKNGLWVEVCTLWQLNKKFKRRKNIKKTFFVTVTCQNTRLFSSKLDHKSNEHRNLCQYMRL